MSPTLSNSANIPFEALLDNAICSVNLAILALEQPDMKNEAAYSIYRAKTHLEEIRSATCGLAEAA